MIELLQDKQFFCIMLPTSAEVSPNSTPKADHVRHYNAKAKQLTTTTKGIESRP